MTKNSLKVWSFLTAVSLCLLFAGYQIASRHGLFLGFVCSLCLHVLVFAFGDLHLIKVFKAVKIEGQDPWGLRELLENLSAKAAIPKPVLYTFPIATPTAFALGHNWNQSAILLSEGAIKNLNLREVEALLAFQVSQIRRLDTFLFGVASTLANTLMGLGRTLDYIWLPNFFRKKKKRRIFSRLISPLVWLCLRLAVHKRVWLENDVNAAHLIENPMTMAETLWKIHSITRTQPFDVPFGTAHLFAVNPLTKDRVDTHLIVHPGIETRIRNLVGFYPI